MTEVVLHGAPVPDDGPTPVYAPAPFGSPGFYGDALEDEKGRFTFIKEVVSLCRKSPEYARYRAYLIEHVELTSCALLGGLSPEEVNSAGLELHHFPLSLFDIVELVLGQLEAEGGRVTTFAVANRVMACHWRGLVGLVPVTQTIHEAAHAGQVTIDLRSVYGAWPHLLEEHRLGVSEALAEKLRAVVGSHESGAGHQQNQQALALIPQRWIADSPTVALLLTPPESNHDE